MDRRRVSLAVRRALPAPVKVTVRRTAETLDPAVRWAYRRRTGDTRPLPPRRLRTRIGATSPVQYRTSGAEVADRIVRGLSLVGLDLASFSSVLDLGSGPGRVLEHLAPRLAEGAEATGCDVDRESIAWARAHTSGVTYVENAFEPPLPFTRDAFDLLIAISVLTHLDEGAQDRWLAEIGRVLRPGGVALLTVLGAVPFERLRQGTFLGATAPMVGAARAHGPLRDSEIVYLPYERSGVNAQGSPSMGDATYGLTFHGTQYVQQRLSSHFALLGHFPRSINVHQDCILVRAAA